MSRTLLRVSLAPAVLVTAFAMTPAQWAPTTARATTVATPGGLTVASVTSTTASLSWTRVTGASGYRIRYSSSPSFANAAGASFTSNSGTVFGLSPATRYWFRVAVAANSGTGAARSAYTRSPYPTTTTRFSTPANLNVTSTTNNGVSLRWQAVSGATGYRVRYSTSPTFEGATGASFPTNAGTVTGLTPGTAYWFRVAVAADKGTGAARSTYTTMPGVRARTEDSAPYDLDVATFNLSSINVSSPGEEPWAQRRAKAVDQLLGQNPSSQTTDAPDVIALQEANNTTRFGTGTQYTDLVSSMNAQTVGTDHFSTVIPAVDPINTRIAYNDGELRLVDKGALKWDAQETAADGYRLMSWGIFQVKSTGAQFFFSSNHLETKSEPVRRRQWQQLIDVVPGLSRGLPVVIAGDFNSVRGAASGGALANPTGSVMLPKMAPAGFGDTMGQQGRGNYYVSRARAERVINGNFNSVNHLARKLPHYANPDIIGQSVDYIFASNNLEVKEWRMVFDAAKTGADEYTLQGVIPSDHNMIRATIVLPAP